jgi:hypothetical protein
VTVIGIDPGPLESAWVEFDGHLLAHGDLLNDDMLCKLAAVSHGQIVAIESLSYQGGRAGVGKETFDTAIWAGRFYQVVPDGRAVLIPRNTVRTRVARSAFAGDPEVRKALIARFGPVGTARQPGPLYGITSHRWAALAVAVTHFDSLKFSIKETA